MSDSSKWSIAIRYGVLQMTGPNLSSFNLTKKDFVKLPPKSTFELFKWYGEDVKLMRVSDEWSNSGCGKRCLERMTFKSVARRIIDIETKIGTKFFAAIGSAWQVKLLEDAYRYWTNKEEGSETFSDLVGRNGFNSSSSLDHGNEEARRHRRDADL
jgi:hypothetical protein